MTTKIIDGIKFFPRTGSHGERDGARRGRHGEGRIVHQRWKRSAPQGDIGLGARAEDHHVTGPSSILLNSFMWLLIFSLATSVVGIFLGIRFLKCLLIELNLLSFQVKIHSFLVRQCYMWVLSSVHVVCFRSLYNNLTDREAGVTQLAAVVVLWNVHRLIGWLTDWLIDCCRGHGSFRCAQPCSPWVSNECIWHCWLFPVINCLVTHRRASTCSGNHDIFSRLIHPISL